VINEGPPTGAGFPPPAHQAGPDAAPWRRKRWLAAGGVATVAGVVGLVLAVQAGAAPACAAPPVGGTAYQGTATFYDSQGHGGNCSYGSAPSDRRYVALSPGEYADAAACGGYLDVTGPKGTVRVLVMDQCPGCPAGLIDLSAEAFADIADPVRGRVPATYRSVVDPPLPGPLGFRIKEGASQWWFAVLVTDHGNPLRSVEARSGSGWRKLVRHDFNYWSADDGLGPGPYTLRVTDVYGHQAVAAGIRMAPGQTQRSDVRMYGGGTAAKPAPVRSTATARPATARPATAGTPASAASPTTITATASPVGTSGPASWEPAGTPPVAALGDPGAVPAVDPVGTACG